MAPTIIQQNNNIFFCSISFYLTCKQNKMVKNNLICRDDGNHKMADIKLNQFLFYMEIYLRNTVTHKTTLLELVDLVFL